MSHVTKISRDLSAASVLSFTFPVFDIVFDMHRSEKEMRRKRCRRTDSSAELVGRGNLYPVASHAMLFLHQIRRM